MKRLKGFDPEEYVNWKPVEAVLEPYTRLAQQAMKAMGLKKSDPILLDLYRNLLLVRLHDTALKRWVKTGKISKAWLGTGEEAVTVGNLAGLEKGDLVGPMIRNAGAPLLKGMPVRESLAYYLGAGDTRTRGRDLHVGGLEYDTVTPISHVAALVPVMTGVGLGFKMRGSDRVAMTWVGDGSTRTGEFHEGMNYAAVAGVPVIFVLQNNQVALGTRTGDYSPQGLEPIAKGYGIKGYVCDGNNVLDVLQVTREAVALCRAGKGPAVIVANTFRMGGHATHDEAEARSLFTKKEFAAWGQKDPVGCYEEFLKGLDPKNAARLEAIESEVEALVAKEAAAALDNIVGRQPAPETVTLGVTA
ncbi:MAG: thiamine pyrophosphate-dependent dehydrogenase E1 component subunit alpha [Planctomycetota bacterium]